MQYAVETKHPMIQLPRNDQNHDKAKPRTATTSDVILLVDDDEDIRTTASLILGLEGYAVCLATDGKEALDMLLSGECRPSLIVSDIAMPNLDGYGFFQAVRQIPVFLPVPFIFLTAYGSRRHIRLGREMGIDDYLVKPFDPEELLTSVRNKLSRARAWQEKVISDMEQARRTLVQLLAHELRTPLTHITGGFELLADAVGSSAAQNNTDDVSASMGLIRNGTQRLNRLAEQVVRYSELITGHTQVQYQQQSEPIQLGSVVDTALGMAANDLHARHISVELNYDATHLIWVYGLPILLSEAIYELIRNAGQYSAEGAKIQVWVTCDETTASVIVRDFGRGIAVEDQASVWDLMIQSGRWHWEQQGAGMGLPIVRLIAEVHQGSVNLHSVPNQGTTVTLHLPLYQGKFPKD